jgi:hypothetical protein
LQVLKSSKKKAKKLAKQFNNPQKTVKKYGKVTATLAGTGIVYALGYEAFRGLLRTLAPSQGVNFENFVTNTDSGLVVQTLALGGAAGLSASMLKNAGVLTKGETTMAVAAGTGLAVGRMLTGLASNDIGKRFSTLLDGEIGLSAFPKPGPTLSTPANAWQLDQIITNTPETGRLHPGLSFNSPYMDSVIQNHNPLLQKSGPFLP